MKSWPVLVFIAFFLTACGGGGGSGSDTSDKTSTPTTTAPPTSTPSQTQTLQDPFLSPPFAEELPLVSWFDHQFPLPGASNGTGPVVNFLGQMVTTEDDHDGYDWGMPAGTAVLAAADGVVSGIAENVCIVPDQSVRLFHERPSAEARGYTTAYGHLSDVIVTREQKVTQGQVIGHSAPGDRPPCHVFNAHLHFGVFRHLVDGRMYVIDPYGWVGSQAIPNDPWAVQPDGGPSIYLWKVAPRLFGPFVR